MDSEGFSLLSTSEHGLITRADVDFCTCGRDSQSQRRRWMRVVTLANVLLLTCTLLVAWLRLSNSRLVNKKCWKVVNGYSPMTDEIDVSFETQKVKGSLENLDDNIYRQSPSPEVDAAWANLSQHRLLHTTRETLRRIGQDPAAAVQFPAEFGLGDNAYAIVGDLTHLVHCLNVIRKDVHFDYYYGTRYPDGKRSELHSVHTSHCLHILLQSLMCSANTDIIPMVWFEDYPWGTPDFNINRKCGNPDGIRKWEADHDVEEELLWTIKKPKGQKQIPASAAMRRLLEIENGWDTKNGII